jgi:hypothetical protein
MKNKLATFAIAILVAGATATAFAATKTNVVENINVNLTVYQQYVPGSSGYGTAATGGTNATGTKLLDHVSTLTSKDIIGSLITVTGTNFGNSAKLVLVTTYSNIVSTNAPYLTNGETISNVTVSTNGDPTVAVNVGGVSVASNIFETTNLVVTNDRGFVYILAGDSFEGSLTTNTVMVLSNGAAISTNTINTNGGYLTTIAASPTNGQITNVSITTQVGTVSNLFEAVYGPNVNVMWGTAAAPVFTDVNNYVSGYFSDAVQAQSDKDLADGFYPNSTNAALYNLYVSNLTAETAVGIANFYLGYFTTATSGTGTNNLLLNGNYGSNPSGFNKVSLKVDTLKAKSHDSAAVVEDIYDATATATVSGSGYIGGTYIPTNAGSGIDVGNYATEYKPGTNIVITGGITNAVPIVVDGTISVTFLKNLPQ